MERKCLFAAFISWSLLMRISSSGLSAHISAFPKNEVPADADAILSRLEAHMRRHEEYNEAKHAKNESCYQPFVTLTYAQTIDGSIAALKGTEQLIISSPESMLMTHQLRSMHDAILVGVQTVNSDDPSLTVRLCPGKNPQPIVLDSKLSINTTCR